jgi:hypothetical protein
MKNIFRKIMSLFLFAVFLTACGPAATPVKPAVPTLPPRPSAVPGGLLIDSVSLTSAGKSPNYVTNSTVPVLQGTYPHRDEFNLRVSDLVTQEIDAFKKNLGIWTPTPGVTETSFSLSYVSLPFSVRYANIQFFEDVFSLAGTVHMSHRTVSLVYDLETAKDVTLDQLFLPGSDYLKTISDYCKNDLKTHNVTFDEQQLNAAETYTVWNLTAGGLVFLFNDFSHTGTIQSALVPYTVLKDISDPQGPLGNVVK